MLRHTSIAEMFCKACVSITICRLSDLNRLVKMRLLLLGERCYSRVSGSLEEAGCRC